MFEQIIIAYFPEGEPSPKLREFTSNDASDEKCYTLRVGMSQILLTESFLKQAAETIGKSKTDTEE